jgi:hypothetical protein
MISIMCCAGPDSGSRAVLTWEDNRELVAAAGAPACPFRDALAQPLGRLSQYIVAGLVASVSLMSLK